MLILLPSGSDPMDLGADAQACRRCDGLVVDAVEHRQEAGELRLALLCLLLRDHHLAACDISTPFNIHGAEHGLDARIDAGVACQFRSHGGFLLVAAEISGRLRANVKRFGSVVSAVAGILAPAIA